MPRKTRSQMAQSNSSSQDPTSARASASLDAPSSAKYAPKITRRMLDLTDTENAPAKKAKHDDQAPPARSSPPKRHESPVGKPTKAAKAAASAAEGGDAAQAKTGLGAETEMVESDESSEVTQGQREGKGRVRRQPHIEAITNNDEDDSEGEGESAGLSDMEFSGEEEEEVEVEANGEGHADGGDEDGESEVEEGEGEEGGGEATPEARSGKPDAKGKRKTRQRPRDKTVAKNVIKGKKQVTGKSNNGLPLASGLSAAWLRSNLKSIAPVYGFGITDELAMDTRPDFSSDRALDHRAATDLVVIGKPVPISQLNPATKNTLVSRVSEGSDDPDSSLLAETHRGPKPRARSATASRKKSSKPVNKGAAKPPRQKMPARRPRRTSNSSDDSPIAGGRPAIPRKSRNNHGLLPPIIASSKPRYLATLSSALYASEEPFDDFKKTSSKFLDTSRKAFEHVWPDLKTTLGTDDVLFSIGYQRMVERRGKIHDAVKVVVENHFSSQRFSPKDIVEWVKWFCATHGGPVFYETPIPQNGVWDTEDPEYTKPRGFLKSNFLIDVGKRFLRDTRDTAFDFGPPRGLIVLILTAYEKIIRSYKTGVYVSMGNFRANLCNNWVKQYSKNFDKTTAKWWNDILKYYVDDDSDCGNVDEMSTLGETRAALPMTP